MKDIGNHIESSLTFLSSRFVNKDAKLLHVIFPLNMQMPGDNPRRLIEVLRAPPMNILYHAPTQNASIWLGIEVVSIGDQLTPAYDNYLRRNRLTLHNNE